MKIVFTSNLYLPIMGGSVMVLDRWARALVQMGHEVVILTKTPGDGSQNFQEWQHNQSHSLQVCRFHGFKESVQVLRHADRVVMIEMSLNWLLAIFAARKRPLVTHHTHLIPPDGKMRVYRWLQYAAGLCIPAVACSRMIAKLWGPHVGVVPNPYDESIFRPLNLERDVDFLFAGRFGPEKGVGIFIAAIENLSASFQKKHGRLPRVVFAGRGPDEPLISALKDAEYPVCEVIHCGAASPAQLANFYNRSKIVVIPSVWQEPFGLIAVEAFACGCKIICSDQPGLREATANLARYCQTGNIQDFSSAMDQVICNSDSDRDIEQCVENHLARHRLLQSTKYLLRACKFYNNRKSLQETFESNFEAAPKAAISSCSDNS